MKEDNELETKITKSQAAFASFTAQLTELQANLKGKMQAKFS